MRLHQWLEAGRSKRWRDGTRAAGIFLECQACGASTPLTGELWARVMERDLPAPCRSCGAEVGRRRW